MATLYYGVHTIAIEDDSHARFVADLIREILAVGASEWLALPIDLDGVSTSADILISPGVVVSVVYARNDHVGDQLEKLADKYPGADE